MRLYCNAGRTPAKADVLPKRFLFVFMFFGNFIYNRSLTIVPLQFPSTAAQSHCMWYLCHSLLQYRTFMRVSGIKHLIFLSYLYSCKSLRSASLSALQVFLFRKSYFSRSSVSSNFRMSSTLSHSVLLPEL